jgi:hypothetical protein
MTGRNVAVLFLFASSNKLILKKKMNCFLADTDKTPPKSTICRSRVKHLQQPPTSNGNGNVFYMYFETHNDDSVIE